MTTPRWTITLAILAGLCFHPTATAQRGADQLKKKLADKLAQKWVANAGWITDFAKAKAKAREQGKQIFAYFTRSYAP